MIEDDKPVKVTPRFDHHGKHVGYHLDEDLFPPEQRPYTARELQLCAEREVKIRQRVYPNRVMTKRMSQATATHQTNMMAQIAREYRLKAEADQQEERMNG